MRISSQQIFEGGIRSVQQHTADVVQAQRQISSGKKFSNASDNALAAGLGSQITFDKAQYTMFKVNQDHLTNYYANVDTQLKHLHDAMAAFQLTMQQAANDTSSDTSRGALIEKMKTLRDTILSFSMSVDANGVQIFRESSTSIGQIKAAPSVELENGISHLDVMEFTPKQTAGNLNPLTGKVNPMNVETLLQDVIDKMQAGVSMASGAADENFDNMGRAVDHVTSLQVKVGLWQNQLDAAIQVTEDQKANIEIQRSNLLDTDLAETTAQLARSNALLQAAQAIITKIDTDTLFQKL